MEYKSFETLSKATVKRIVMESAPSGNYERIKLS